jgi:hypothetical protein
MLGQRVAAESLHRAVLGELHHPQQIAFQVRPAELSAAASGRMGDAIGDATRSRTGALMRREARPAALPLLRCNADRPPIDAAHRGRHGVR